MESSAVLAASSGVYYLSLTVVALVSILVATWLSYAFSYFRKPATNSVNLKSADYSLVVGKTTAATTGKKVDVTGDSLFTGDIDATGTFDVDGAATFGSTMATTGAATFGSTTATTGAATFGSTVGVTGAVTLSDTLVVDGAATFSTTAGVTGLLSCTGGIRPATVPIGTAAGTTVTSSLSGTFVHVTQSGVAAFAITLPIAQAGWWFRFRIGVAAAENVTIVTNGGSPHFFGTITHANGTTPVVQVNAANTLTFVGGTCKVGDWIEIVGISVSGWQVIATSSADGGITAA